MGFWRVIEVKACHKQKCCNWCDERILVGTRKTCTASVYEGDFHYSHYHPECYKAMLEWCEDNKIEDELPERGSMHRGSTLSKDD